MKSKLKVYKASAGSGKTFTLAIEYIKLLINNPTSYRNTLAVTFTNKATEEMKMRILSQLYGIWKQMPDSQNYLERIVSDLHVGPTFASKRAGQALSLLIHDYHHFRVETIDTFFQGVLRNLAKELDLAANLKIELNDREVEEKAVDRLIENLEASSKVLSWIISYIQKNIDEEKGWNVIGKIKGFGENIFKDTYKSNRKEINQILLDEHNFKSITDALRQLTVRFEENMKQCAATFFDCLAENGLSVSDFMYGESGVCGYFIKLQKGIYEGDELLKTRVCNAMEDSQKWAKKSDWKPGCAIYDAVTETLHPLLIDTERMRSKQAVAYRSAILTLKHIHELRLLHHIDVEVRTINKDVNRFMLSDTQSLLNELISDSDTPFIYEKIGTQIENIMIDEFQDTSLIQWKNFKVLLLECLSKENSQNMVVGDVKQSIYRWRDGDWRLLNNIEKEFDREQVEQKSLQTNYRSCKNIVDFNNAFFEEATRLESKELSETDTEEVTQLKKAYEDVRQYVPDTRRSEGLVQIELLPKTDYWVETMQYLSDKIKELTAKGVPYKDIAILVRSNKTIQDIADYFMVNHPEVSLVSDEAFRLDSSLSVNLIVDALKFIAHPEDILCKTQLVKVFQKRILHNELTDSQLLVSDNKMDKLLPHEFIDAIETLSSMPIIDLAEELFRIFKLEQFDGQSAYVCAFFDQLHRFFIDNPTDIDTFIKEWESTIAKKTIHSDEIDGIRLLTIHKSKGLEFANVFMPFCDWKLEKTSLIWCVPPKEENPFNLLPLIPIDYSKKQMKETFFTKDYDAEHFQNTVDNLNLLYVAFTRAKHNLFIYGRREDKGSRSFLIESCLENVAAQLTNALFKYAKDDKETKMYFSFGELYIPTSNKKEDHSANVFNLPISSRSFHFESSQRQTAFIQSNASRDFVGQSSTNEAQNQYIQLGNVLHQIFSMIRTKEDIDTALAMLEQDGILYNPSITKKGLKELINKRLNDKRVSDWFSDRWTLFNECTILSYDDVERRSVEHRPDRVMTDGNEVVVVDFKFGTPQPAHLDQVRRYMSLLKGMGHDKVKGYLWYVYSNKITEII
ncbi:MAG: UvrD-helicase domain-containing protein [Prevotella sp.]|nr:UvrD-helicase domain-containing protein [Prevotella sp.]